MKIKKHMVAAGLAVGFAAVAMATSTDAGAPTARTGYMLASLADADTPTSAAMGVGGSVVGAAAGVKVGLTVGAAVGGPVGALVGAGLGAL